MESISCSSSDRIMVQSDIPRFSPVSSGETWTFPDGHSPVVGTSPERRIVEIGGRKYSVFNSYGINDVGPEISPSNFTGEADGVLDDVTLRSASEQLACTNMFASSAAALAASLVVAHNCNRWPGAAHAKRSRRINSKERRQLLAKGPGGRFSLADATCASETPHYGWLAARPTQSRAFVPGRGPDLGAEPDLHVGSDHVRTESGTRHDPTIDEKALWIGRKRASYTGSVSAFKRISLDGHCPPRMSEHASESHLQPGRSTKESTSDSGTDGDKDEVAPASSPRPRHWHPTQARHAFKNIDAPVAGQTVGVRPAAAPVSTSQSSSSRTRVRTTLHQLDSSSLRGSASQSPCPSPLVTERQEPTTRSRSFPSAGLRMTAQLHLIEPCMGRRGLYPCGDPACQCLGNVYLHMGAAGQSIELEIGLEQIGASPSSVVPASTSTSTLASARTCSMRGASNTVDDESSKQAIRRFKMSQPEVDLFYNGLGAVESRVVVLPASAMPASARPRWVPADGNGSAMQPQVKLAGGRWVLRFTAPEPTGGSLVQCRIRLDDDVMLTGSFDVRTKPAEWVLVHGGPWCRPAGLGVGAGVLSEAARRLVLRAAHAQHTDGSTVASRKAALQVEIKDIIEASPSGGSRTTDYSATGGAPTKSAIGDMPASVRGPGSEGPAAGSSRRGGCRVFVRLGSRTQANSVLQGFRIMRGLHAESNGAAVDASARGGACGTASTRNRRSARGNSRKASRASTSGAAAAFDTSLSVTTTGTGALAGELAAQLGDVTMSVGVSDQQLCRWMYVSFMCSLNKVPADASHLAAIPAPVDPLFAPVFAQREDGVLGMHPSCSSRASMDGAIAGNSVVKAAACTADASVVATVVGEAGASVPPVGGQYGPRTEPMATHSMSITASGIGRKRSRDLTEATVREAKMSHGSIRQPCDCSHVALSGPPVLGTEIGLEDESVYKKWRGALGASGPSTGRVSIPVCPHPSMGIMGIGMGMGGMRMMDTSAAAVGMPLGIQLGQRLLHSLPAAIDHSDSMAAASRSGSRQSMLALHAAVRNATSRVVLQNPVDLTAGLVVHDSIPIHENGARLAMDAGKRHDSEGAESSPSTVQLLAGVSAPVDARRGAVSPGGDARSHFSDWMSDTDLETDTDSMGAACVDSDLVDFEEGTARSMEGSSSPSNVRLQEGEEEEEEDEEFVEEGLGDVHGGYQTWFHGGVRQSVSGPFSVPVVGLGASHALNSRKQASQQPVSMTARAHGVLRCDRVGSYDSTQGLPEWSFAGRGMQDATMLGLGNEVTGIPASLHTARTSQEEW